jgi:hypothetical protein
MCSTKLCQGNMLLRERFFESYEMEVTNLRFGHLKAP